MNKFNEKTPVWLGWYWLKEMATKDKNETAKRSYIQKWENNVDLLVKNHTRYNINVEIIGKLKQLWAPYHKITFDWKEDPQKIHSALLFFMGLLLEEKEKYEISDEQVDLFKRYKKSFETLGEFKKYILSEKFNEYIEHLLHEYWVYEDLVHSILVDFAASVRSVPGSILEKRVFENYKPPGRGRDSDYLINYTMIKVVDAVRLKNADNIVREATKHRIAIAELINALAGYRAFDQENVENLRKRIDDYTETERKNAVIYYIENMIQSKKKS